MTLRELDRINCGWNPDTVLIISFNTAAYGGIKVSAIKDIPNVYLDRYVMGFVENYVILEGGLIDEA